MEDQYVSFEVAKLLSEHGFDEPCKTSYSKLDKKLGETAISDWGKANQYKAPTQQLAMRWLREVHKIGVFPSTYCITVGDKVTHPYGTCIINLNTHEIMVNDCMPSDSYEEACEAAMKYCLENIL